MSPSKPTIIIVNGSFSPSPLYVKTTTLLQNDGYKVIVADYPSIGNRDPKPAATMEDDAAYVNDLLQKLADQDEDIVVVAHSYGGVPASEGIKGLAKSIRQKEGKSGGVVRILYVAALVPEIGQGLADLMGTEPAPFVRFNGEYMELEPEGNAKINFSDLPYDEALEWAKKMPSHSMPSFGGRLSYPGYRDVPVSYLFTTEDPVVVPELQQRCIGIIETAKGEKVDVVSLDSGHFPFLSRAEETARIIEKVASI